MNESSFPNKTTPTVAEKETKAGERRAEPRLDRSSLSKLSKIEKSWEKRLFRFILKLFFLHTHIIVKSEISYVHLHPRSFFRVLFFEDSDHSFYLFFWKRSSALGKFLLSKCSLLYIISFALVRRDPPFLLATTSCWTFFISMYFTSVVSPGPDVIPLAA